MSTKPHSITVCIPARNEQAYLGACLESVRRAEAELGEPVEIIVALNRCTDRTEEIARAGGAILVREHAKNLSKIRNAAARAASGEILVTIDADSRMAPGVLRAIRERLASGRAVGGGVMIRPERLSPGILVTGVVILLLVLPFRLSGGLFWCFKRDFDGIGGFDEDVLMAEDLDFAWRLKRHGARTGRRFQTLWRTPIVSSCRKFDRFGDWHLLHPRFGWNFLRGSMREIANRHWYDVER